MGGRELRGRGEREDSRFWERGGLDVDLGLGGLSVELESLRSFMVGGISLSTPTRPRARVRTGHRFVLHAEPEEEWLRWQPPLALGREPGPRGCQHTTGARRGGAGRRLARRRGAHEPDNDAG